MRKETVSPDARSMWTRRQGKDGLKTIAHQSTAWATPSRISKPAGVCIQEFSASIQKADSVVPKATRKVASVWTPLDTRLKPNSMMPRKTASRKKAVSTS